MTKGDPDGPVVRVRVPRRLSPPPRLKLVEVAYVSHIEPPEQLADPPYSQFLNSSFPPLTDQSLSTVISDEIPPLTLVLSDNLRRLGP